MAIIDQVGRRSFKIRLLIAAMYTVLAILGVTMVYPFLITLSSSTSTAMDFQRYSPIPRSVFSRKDRFVRGLVPYYNPLLRNCMDELAMSFTDVPSTWATWDYVGRDAAGVDKFSGRYLGIAADKKQWACAQKIAADYADFSLNYPLTDTICSLDGQHSALFLHQFYMKLAQKEAGNRRVKNADLNRRALEMVQKQWGIPAENFYLLDPSPDVNAPLDQQSYQPNLIGRGRDALLFKQAYVNRDFIPKRIKQEWYDLLSTSDARSVLGIAGNGSITLDEFNKAAGTNFGQWNDVPFPVTSGDTPQLRKLWAHYIGTCMPMCETRPFAAKTVWLRYLGSEDVRNKLKLKPGGLITVEEYNKVFGTKYQYQRNIPFPLPADAAPALRAVWDDFIQTTYPLRLVEIKVTPALTASYRNFVMSRFHGDLKRLNSLLDSNYPTWNAVDLRAKMPIESTPKTELWTAFVLTLPVSDKIIHSAEDDWQHKLLAEYGSLAGVNKAYGWKLSHIEEAYLPIDIAYLVMFVRNEKPIYSASLSRNYAFVLDYLLKRGRAALNTLILISLSLLGALTVNPLAAYGMSRFQMKQTPGVILFLLATMAFPGAISMIPGFLLMRDLHLLNTYWALILPGLASGMGIFLLKGFFDSLPPELYEAAALDGAKEWQVFLKITLPLSKPVLAVIALGHFMAAYGSWEWAIVVCQNPKMWTLAVWLYQFTLMGNIDQWCVMAAFVIASLPVMLVFLLCQNIILRGIILPQMK